MADDRYSIAAALITNEISIWTIEHRLSHHGDPTILLSWELAVEPHPPPPPMKARYCPLLAYCSSWGDFSLRMTVNGGTDKGREGRHRRQHSSELCGEFSKSCQVLLPNALREFPRVPRSELWRSGWCDYSSGPVEGITRWLWLSCLAGNCGEPWYVWTSGHCGRTSSRRANTRRVWCRSGSGGGETARLSERTLEQKTKRTKGVGETTTRRLGFIFGGCFIFMNDTSVQIPRYEINFANALAMAVQ